MPLDYYGGNRHPDEMRPHTVISKELQLILMVSCFISLAVLLGVFS